LSPSQYPCALVTVGRSVGLSVCLSAPDHRPPNLSLTSFRPRNHPHPRDTAPTVQRTMSTQHRDGPVWKRWPDVPSTADVPGRPTNA